MHPYVALCLSLMNFQKIQHCEIYETYKLHTCPKFVCIIRDDNTNRMRSLHISQVEV